MVTFRPTAVLALPGLLCLAPVRATAQEQPRLIHHKAAVALGIGVGACQASPVAEDVAGLADAQVSARLGRHFDGALRAQLVLTSKHSSSFDLSPDVVTVLAVGARWYPGTGTSMRVTGWAGIADGTAGFSGASWRSDRVLPYVGMDLSWDLRLSRVLFAAPTIGAGLAVGGTITGYSPPFPVQQVTGDLLTLTLGLRIGVGFGS